MIKTKINYIHLCDAANIDGSGKLSILGIFNILYLPSLPMKYPRMTAVMDFSIDDYQKKSHKLNMSIFGPDEKELVIKPAIEINFEMPKQNIKNDKAQLKIILDLANLEFLEYGKHYIRVNIDGETVHKIEFDVELLTKQNG